MNCIIEKKSNVKPETKDCADTLPGSLICSVSMDLPHASHSVFTQKEVWAVQTSPLPLRYLRCFGSKWIKKAKWATLQSGNGDWEEPAAEIEGRWDKVGEYSEVRSGVACVPDWCLWLAFVTGGRLGRVKVLVVPASETAARATWTAVCFFCLLPVFDVCVSGACWCEDCPLSNWPSNRVSPSD